jgi:hypothetical protein
VEHRLRAALSGSGADSDRVENRLRAVPVVEGLTFRTSGGGFDDIPTGRSARGLVTR